MRERDNLEDLDLDKKIMLKWVFSIYVLGRELDLSG